MTEKQLANELGKIARQNSGMLSPQAVVRSASRESSPLHDRFNWNDTHAAHLYRLEQARHLIRSVVTIIEENKLKRPVRVFVSLSNERTRNDGGYRNINVVLSRPALRRQMLIDALDEMRMFEQKYSRLTELSRLFKVSRELQQKLSRMFE